MKVSFALTRSDVASFMLYYALRSRVLYAVQLFATAIFALELWYDGFTMAGMLTVVFLVIAIPCSFLLGCLFIAASRGQRTHCTVSLEPDHLVGESKHSRTQWEWRFVQGIARAHGHLVIWVSDGPIFIPRRAFVEEHDLEAFCQDCQARLGQGQTHEAPAAASDDEAMTVAFTFRRWDRAGVCFCTLYRKPLFYVIQFAIVAFLSIQTGCGAPSFL